MVARPEPRYNMDPSARVLQTMPNLRCDGLVLGLTVMTYLKYLDITNMFNLTNKENNCGQPCQTQKT